MLRELGLFSLEKRKLRGHLIKVYKHPKRGVYRTEEDRATLCSVVPSDRRGGNGHKLEKSRFPPNTRKHFFSMKMTEDWHRLP